MISDMRFQFFTTLLLIFTSSLHLDIFCMKENPSLTEGAKGVWTIVNAGKNPLYIRFRIGEVGPKTQKLMPTANNNLRANRETLVLNENNSIAINLNELPLDEPFRIRFWPYKPVEDIDEQGNPTETSEMNQKQTKAFQWLPRRIINDPSYNGGVSMLMWDPIKGLVNASENVRHDSPELLEFDRYK